MLASKGDRAGGYDLDLHRFTKMEEERARPLLR